MSTNIKIIPAIDIIDGKCVRLEKGAFEKKKVYSENPVEVAKRFESNGYQFLHIVDLDGAKNGKLTNTKLVKQIAEQTNLWIDFGGGITSEEEIEFLLSIGVKQVTIGSLAVKDPKKVVRWIQKYGADKLIVGADIIGENIAINGWLDSSSRMIFEFLDFYLKNGARRVICTDVSKDGMLEGPSLPIYQKIVKQFPSLELVASGGVSSKEDIELLEKIGCESVIVGKAFYEGKIELK